MVSHTRSWIASLLISLLAILPMIALANDNTGSAHEFVKEWITTYGIHHDRAAAMMTTRYRGGMSEAEWVDVYQPALEAVRYKHLGGTLIRVDEDAHKAKVVLKSIVDSINGPVVQHEIYDLVKVDGTWLLDFIDIQDEHFDAARDSTPTQRIDPRPSTPPSEHAPSP